VDTLIRNPPCPRCCQASKGADPATAKKEGRRAETIGDLAELYIEQHAKPKKRSWKADDNLLRRKVLPAWRHRAIVDVKRPDILALVQKVAKDGAPIVANRVAALLSKLFAFALATVHDGEGKPLLEASPAARIPRPGQERKRDRVLTVDEVRTLWKSFDALDVPMAAFYKLRLLTAQRGGEVATMRWSDLGLESKWWTIPSTASKNKLAHRVPLSTSAVDLLTKLRPKEDQDAKKHQNEKKDQSKNEEQIDPSASFVVAGARGKRQQANAAATFTVDNFRGHDLRRTAASMMASGGVPRLVINKILNHVERDITAVYDRHSYDAEKRAALDWWDLKLEEIL
jgi:integrase